MAFVSKRHPTTCWRKKWSRNFLAVWLVVLAFPTITQALPERLVLALDGISFRDLKALQAGFTTTNFWGKSVQHQAFTAAEGYFPVSRMISTFPSVSDVAWTDVFGDRPLPGYQRTYFSRSANSQVSINGVTTTMEHERQMNFQVESGYLRAMSYMFPSGAYEYEVRMMCEQFWETTNRGSNFYVYLRASDDAQHMDRDISAMLVMLDKQFQDLRARYMAKEGRDLQIIILSDHGHNHAGRGRRVPIYSFLEEAGYHIATSINGPKDVVLPTVGIESWVEIHNAPSETGALMQQLVHLEGVDVIAAPIVGQMNRFMVMNSKGERATIDWNPAQDSFRYSPERGDPINYRPVVETLARSHQLDAAGFATADAWMTATMTHHYPLALERIVRGFTHVTLNPATIIISLDNRYVNAGWLVQQGSRLVTCGSTHGGLDDLCSDGILLSNFTPTHDTSTHRVAGQFDDFAGVRNFRQLENGAEWVTKSEQAMTRIARVPFDRDYRLLPDDGIFLRLWSPALASRDRDTPIQVTFEKIPQYASVDTQRGNHNPVKKFQQQITLDSPISFPDKAASECVYALPASLELEPCAEYQISGWIQDRGQAVQLFAFQFHTGSDGSPLAF